MPLTSCSQSPDDALGQSAAGLDQRHLVIHSGGKEHRFVVEVARSPQEQAYGMMNRQSVAPDRGMIFPYSPPDEVSFWMRDTLIPLDIIFIAPGGTIHRIESNAVPMALDPVLSGAPVEAVLELGGGRSEELGLKPGDRVEWTNGA